MIKNLYLCQSAAAFSQGQWTGIAAEGEGVVLAREGEGYLTEGFFETPPITLRPFAELLPAWNADTPAGTSVEVFARVMVGEFWSRWFSFGAWSTFCEKASAAPAAEDTVHAEADRLWTDGLAATFQLRAVLRGTPDGLQTPYLRLLSGAVRAAGHLRAPGAPLHRSIPVPAYSERIRAPGMAGKISAPTSLTMLLNRFGSDLLPEEIAHLCRDTRTGLFESRALCCAAAGCHGYEAYPLYTDLEGLKNELRKGCACAAEVAYTNNAATAAEQRLPLLTGAAGTARRHTLVVHGFDSDDDGTEYVLANDPLASCDDTAVRRYPADEFAAAFSGIALFVHKREPAGAHVCAPVHLCAELRRSELPDEYAFYLHGERRSLPPPLDCNVQQCTGTVCYALQDAHAYATTAHKCFFYTDVTLSGNLRLELQHLPAGTRATVYLIDPCGNAAVAEVRA